MDYFKYDNGILCAENLSIEKIADAVGTPFYCYSTSTIERHYNAFKHALKGVSATILYAVKANSNIAVIKTLANMGAGADVVSSGELLRCLKAGIPAEKIVFSGVGKTKEELAKALSANILQINVESESELNTLNEIARTMEKKARIGIRINPDVDANTHSKITTGRLEDKFGIEWSRVNKIFSDIKNLEHIEVVGLAMHIGSQLTNLQPFKDAFIRLRELVLSLNSNGHIIKRLDLGGGLGIPYDKSKTPSPLKYGKLVEDVFGELDCDLLFEPGRIIVGNAGILVTSVIHVKKGSTKDFVIIDAAMNDLIRPSLYEAKHSIITVKEPSPKAKFDVVDVVGPVCETGDKFGTDIELPKINSGDLLIIRSAGAYGAVMASTYNSRPLIPEIIVKGSNYEIVRKRIEPETMLNFEQIPNWLN